MTGLMMAIASCSQQPPNSAPPLPRLGQTQIRPPGGRLLTAIPLPRCAPTPLASAALGVPQRCRRQGFRSGAAAVAACWTAHWPAACRPPWPARPQCCCWPGLRSGAAAVAAAAAATWTAHWSAARRPPWPARPQCCCWPGLRSGAVAAAAAATWTAHWSAAPSSLASPAPVLLLARAPQRCRHRCRPHRDLDRRLARCAPSPLASPARELLLAGDPQRCRCRHRRHRRSMARCAPMGPTSRASVPAAVGPSAAGSAPTSAADSKSRGTQGTGSRSRKARGHKSATSRPQVGCVRDTRCSPATAADVRRTAGHAAKPRTAF